MPDKVIKILLKLQSESEENCPFVFLNMNRYKIVRDKWHMMVKEHRAKKWENRLLENNLLRDFKRQCIWAGIRTNDKLTIHCLRKAYGTNLANKNIPSITLKKLMGHSNIKTTMEYYLKSSDENEKKAVEILDNLGSLVP